MPKTCSNCGSPIDDGSRFCTVCGTPVAVQTVAPDRYCVQCGNLLKPGIKFCEVCGREVAAEKPKEQPQIKEPTTMDEVVVPEITSETFAGSNEKKMGMNKFDGFEAAVMPDSQPAQPSAPAPAPEFSMDTAYSSEEPKKTSNTVSVKPVIKSQPQTYSQPQSMPNPMPGSMPRSDGYPAPGMPIPTTGADGKEKKGSNIVPIILVILIVAVIVADIIVFTGKKKDDDGEKDAALIVNTAELSVQSDNVTDLLFDK